MSKTARIIVAILFLFIVLGSLGLGIYGLVLPHYGLAATGFLLAVVFGGFVVHDAIYLLGSNVRK